MRKKFLKFTNADPEVKEMFPDTDIYVTNNNGDDICGIVKSYQIGRKKQPATIFPDGLSQIYLTSECHRQLADKLDSLEGVASPSASPNTAQLAIALMDRIAESFESDLDSDIKEESVRDATQQWRSATGKPA